MYCHELWQFNDRTGYQWLRGFQALCEDCHDTKHITFARNAHRRAQLMDHFMAVNQLTRSEAEACFEAAAHLQQRLDQRHWIINFGDYHLRMPALADVTQRKQYAQLNRPRYHR